MNKNILTAAVLCVALNVMAQAQGPGAQKRGGACKADMQTLCAGEKGNTAMACLVAKFDRIQDAECKAVVQERQALNDAVKQDCAAEIKADKCESMDIGTGLLKCLAKDRASLSDACKAAIRRNAGHNRRRNRRSGDAAVPKKEASK